MNVEEEYSDFSVAARQNIVEVSWQETYQDRPAQTEIQSDGKITSNENSLIFPTGIATILFVALVGIFFKRLRSLKGFNEPSINNKDSRQASCHRCRFFNNNAYLKCAVHPCTVLTSQAKDCSDYWPQHQNDFFYR